MSYVKILERSAVFTWSPATVFPQYLAAGTNGQQFDPSFNTESNIDLCELNFSSPNASQAALQITANGNAEHRFNQLCWTDFGDSSRPLGTLIGACDNGIISYYDPSLKLNAADGRNWCVCETQKHSGSVRALDVNPFQKKLLASGASNGDVFIWDATSPGQPMSPGPRPQTDQHLAVTSIAWNNKVEHILASLYPTFAYIWDLRRSEGPIMKLGDVGRGQWVCLKWHPESSTTLCLASADDQLPVVQMWDVRFANAACMQLDGHQRGVLSMDWCPKDPDLLVTCGKDAKIYVWNPNSGQFYAEIPYPIGSVRGGMVNSWPFQVQWSRRDPSLVGVGSFDGRVAICSLTGAVAAAPHLTEESTATTPKLAESFPGADFATQPAAIQKMIHDRQSHSAQQSIPRVHLPLPPKWFRTTCGARFGFGGRLVQFSHSAAPAVDGATTAEQVFPSVELLQVVTDKELHQKVEELQAALESGVDSLSKLSDLCSRRAEVSSDVAEKYIWKGLKSHLEQDPSTKYVEILNENSTASLNGAKDTSIDASIKSLSLSPVNGVRTPRNYLSSQTSEGAEDDDFDKQRNPWPLPGQHDGVEPLVLPRGTSSQSAALCQLILTGNYTAAIDLCISEGKWMDAAQLSIMGNRKQFDDVQRRYYMSTRDPVSRLICLLVNERLETLIGSVDKIDENNWRDLFTALVNFSSADSWSTNLDQLAQRMKHTPSEKYAPLCYIAAGLIDGFVESLISLNKSKSLTPEQLHDVMEKATILRISLGAGSQRVVPVFKLFVEKLSQYVTWLAEQGCLVLALHLLDAVPCDSDQILSELKHRLYVACSGLVSSHIRQPKAPFGTVLQQSHHQGLPRSRNTSVASQSAYGYTAPVYQAQGIGSSAPPPIANSAVQSSLLSARRGSQSQSRHPTYGTETINNSAPPIANMNSSGPVYSQSQQPNYAQSSAMAYQQQPTQASMSYATGYAAGPPVQSSQMQQPLLAQLPLPPVAPANQLPHSSWNDPPPLSPKKKSVAKPETPTPVSFPFYNPAAQAGVPQQNSYGSHSAAAPQNLGYQGYSYPAVSQPQQQQASPAVVAAAPVVKAPAEHQKVLDVLSRLGELAGERALTSQSKKRIEENAHKLHIHLQSLLAARKLSPLTLNELHQMTDYICANDYGTALALHAQMAEGPDFSAVAVFLPPLKAVLQAAIHHNAFFC